MSRGRQTERNARIVAEYLEGVPLAEIARRNGLAGPGSVGHVLRREGVGPNRRSGWRRGADLIEDASWLADDGANLTGALARLGMKAETFRRACSRAGRLDVYERLADREPDAERRRRIRDQLRSTTT